MGQVSSSIENIALHELVSEQAVTDELTGLSNNRRFRELISKEAARAQRFGHELSLLMLDIDDFKRDQRHLRPPAGRRGAADDRRACFRSESRGVDEPARYGGEEFAVALPETGLAGARGARGAHSRPDRVARRSRASRARGRSDHRQRGGGVDARSRRDTARTLIAAADAALYEAKRSGKNRVSGAPEKGRRRPERGEPSANEP